MCFIDDDKGMSRFLLLLVVFLNFHTSIACQTKQKNIESALKQCQQLLDSDDVIGANECYGRAIIAHPGSSNEISKTAENSILDKCIELLKKKKNYEQAIICFEGLSVLLPDKSSVFIYLAESYYKYNKAIGDKTDESLVSAEESVKKAIRLRPESAIAHETYGRILEQKGDLQGALREHKEAAGLEPKDGLYWITLASVQEKLNDSASALESYKKALEINPDDTNALDFLAGFYEKIGKLDEAIETIEKRNKLETANEETLQKLNELKQKRDFEKQKPKTQKAKPPLAEQIQIWKASSKNYLRLRMGEMQITLRLGQFCEKG